MPGCALGRFESAAEYVEQLREFAATVEPASTGPFEAKLVRLDLAFCHLIDARESAARVGSFTVPAGWFYACFSVGEALSPAWNGKTMGRAEILFARGGTVLQQRTDGPTHWGLIGIPSLTMEVYSRGMVDGGAMPLSQSAVVQVGSALRKRLLNLHCRIVRMVETRPAVVFNAQAARAIEQEVIEAVVTCMVCDPQPSLPPLSS